MTTLFCHACQRSCPESTPPEFGRDGERLCPLCRSDFVEITDNSAQGSSPFSFGFQGGPGDLTTGLLADALASLAGVPRPMPHRRVGGTTVHFTFGTGPDLGAPQTLPMGQFMDVLSRGGATDMHSLVMLTNQLFGTAGIQPGFGDAAGGNSMDAILTQIMNQYQPHHVPTSRATRDALPKRRVAPRSPDTQGREVAGEATDAACARAGDTCTICHDEFPDDAEVVELPCKHCYHGDCIMPWLETHNTCPVCRTELPTDNPGHEAARTATAARDSSGSAGQAAAGAGNVDNLLFQVQARVSNVQSQMQSVQVGRDAQQQQSAADQDRAQQEPPQHGSCSVQ